MAASPRLAVPPSAKRPLRCWIGASGEGGPRFRKRIEEVFGWAKGSAGLAKVKLRGQAKVDAVFTLALAAYILFENNGSGEFAFGCSTGHIWQASSTDATSIDFSWSGNDEMDEVSGNGSAELQPDGSLHGEICYHNGNDCDFIARRWTSSTAC